MMETLSPKERDSVKAFIILAVFIAGLVGYYYWWVVKPQLAKDKEQATKLNSEIKVLDEKLRAMDVAEANLEAMREKQALLQQISAKLPNSIDAPGFYQALVKILQVTRVEYSELLQQKELVRQVYTEIPYKIVSRARFHDMGQFLNLIEENPDRFMRVKKFVIENNDKRPSIHPATVELATFMFNSKG
jgi:Tfp pilus assembly protein PilO